MGDGQIVDPVEPDEDEEDDDPLEVLVVVDEVDLARHARCTPARELVVQLSGVGPQESVLVALEPTQPLVLRCICFQFTVVTLHFLDEEGRQEGKMVETFDALVEPKPVVMVGQYPQRPRKHQKHRHQPIGQRVQQIMRQICQPLIVQQKELIQPFHLLEVPRQRVEKGEVHIRIVVSPVVLQLSEGHIGDMVHVAEERLGLDVLSALGTDPFGRLLDVPVQTGLGERGRLADNVTEGVLHELVYEVLDVAAGLEGRLKRRVIGQEMRPEHKEVIIPHLHSLHHVTHRPIRRKDPLNL